MAGGASVARFDADPHPNRPGHFEKAERFFSVAFSPDGWTLASGGWDATALLWDLGSVDQKARE